MCYIMDQNTLYSNSITTLLLEPSKNKEYNVRRVTISEQSVSKHDVNENLSSKILGGRRSSLQQSTTD